MTLCRLQVEEKFIDSFAGTSWSHFLKLPISVKSGISFLSKGGKNFSNSFNFKIGYRTSVILLRSIEHKIYLADTPQFFILPLKSFFYSPTQKRKRLSNSTEAITKNKMLFVPGEL